MEELNDGEALNECAGRNVVQKDRNETPPTPLPPSKVGEAKERGRGGGSGARFPVSFRDGERVGDCVSLALSFLFVVIRVSLIT
jgi:hypothetical protein